jgi:phosphate transport system ATP-binding protein
MVFQRPNAFPLSIFDNIAYGPRIWSITDKKTLRDIVERSLAAVDLFDALKNRLKESALSLSAEKQQRLCIARLLAVEPEILLMDEPCSSLDPIATGKIEELMLELKRKYTIIIVTHNMQQAARIADEVGFMLLGELVEFNSTKKIFTNPSDKRTFDYISGRFG